MDRITNLQQVADNDGDVETGTLALSMGDAACFGGMVGCGETYVPAFALAIGLGETASGLVASVPLLAGGILQLVSPYGIRLVGGLRRWIVLGAGLQALAFVPLVIAALIGSISLPLLFLVASAYWAAGLSTGPAWNTWMERQVPRVIRARYFSRRSRLQMICTFGGLLAGGLLLQYAAGRDQVLTGFAMLFCVAGILRLISASFLHRQDPWNQFNDFSGTPTFARITLSDDGAPSAAKRLLLYLVLMQVFVQLSGPYFVPYMLMQLDFSYGQYVFLISLCFISKVISISFWGKYVERAGATKLLWIGGIGLVPLASLWILSSSLWWLAAIQITSGIAWAAYELGFFLSFFETLPHNQRTRLLTIYNLANTGAICIGALVGWMILNHFGCHSTTYYCLFGASSIGRLSCLGILIGLALPKRAAKSIAMRILSIRPGAASVSAPVIASQSDGSREFLGKD